MMGEIINRQRAHPVDRERWANFSDQALREVAGSGQSATIVFVSDQAMRKLNFRFRHIDQPTDVLSFCARDSDFPCEPNEGLGEVVISVERALDQAQRNGLSLEDEIAQLILHGLLHLGGYDHENDNGEMNRLEMQLRRKLGI